MKLIIMAALLFSLLPQHQTVDRRVAIIFVEPTGETFTQQEQATAYQKVRESADYWQDLSPITTTITIVSTQFITTTEDVYNDPYGLMQTSAVNVDPSALPFLVIDNTESRRDLLGDALGLGSSVAIYVVSSADASIYAHEFGHSLYDLPHQYQADYDIMNLFPLSAYQRHMIGCPSLAVLGRPCTTIALPMISRD